jgi:hypothetical protein
MTDVARTSRAGSWSLVCGGLAFLFACLALFLRAELLLLLVPVFLLLSVILGIAGLFQVGAAARACCGLLLSGGGFLTAGVLIPAT